MFSKNIFSEKDGENRIGLFIKIYETGNIVVQKNKLPSVSSDLLQFEIFFVSIFYLYLKFEIALFESVGFEYFCLTSVA